MSNNFITVLEVQNQMKDTKDCVILDIREPGEFRQEHIDDSQHIPLSKLQNHAHTLNREQTYFILCRSGNRACKAVDQMAPLAFSNLRVIEGGIQAWKAAGLSTIVGKSKTWSLERQVRFTAGLLVTTGLVLGFFFHPYFYALSTFVGVGLMFSALTNTCGMGMILAKLPWNQ